MLNDELYKVICVRLREFSLEPECIIMHPETCKKLMVEIGVNNSSDYEKISNLKYQGIPIYRSLDIPEGEFKVC